LPTPSEIADLCTYASDSEGIEHRPPTDAHEDGGQGEVDRNADPELAARADAIQERFDQAGWS
jgi:hypothetical protein